MLSMWFASWAIVGGIRAAAVTTEVFLSVW